MQKEFKQQYSTYDKFLREKYQTITNLENKCNSALINVASENIDSLVQGENQALVYIQNFAGDQSLNDQCKEILEETNKYYQKARYYSLQQNNQQEALKKIKDQCTNNNLEEKFIFLNGINEQNFNNLVQEERDPFKLMKLAEQYDSIIKFYLQGLKCIFQSYNDEDNDDDDDDDDQQQIQLKVGPVKNWDRVIKKVVRDRILNNQDMTKYEKVTDFNRAAFIFQDYIQINERIQQLKEFIFEKNQDYNFMLRVLLSPILKDVKIAQLRETLSLEDPKRNYRDLKLIFNLEFTEFTKKNDRIQAANKMENLLNSDFKYHKIFGENKGIQKLYRIIIQNLKKEVEDNKICAWLQSNNYKFEVQFQLKAFYDLDTQQQQHKIYEILRDIQNIPENWKQFKLFGNKKEKNEEIKSQQLQQEQQSKQQQKQYQEQYQQQNSQQQQQYQSQQQYQQQQNYYQPQQQKNDFQYQNNNVNFSSQQQGNNQPQQVINQQSTQVNEQLKKCDRCLGLGTNSWETNVGLPKTCPKCKGTGKIKKT